MKIRTIKFENHPILKNLELDFTNNGATANTIIVAGENGLGKSVLLNTIFKLSHHGLSHIQRDEKITYELELSQTEIEVLRTNGNDRKFFSSNIVDNIVKIHIDYNIINNWKQIQISLKTPDGYSGSITGSLFQYPYGAGLFKSIFSDAEIDFYAAPVLNVTSRNIDVNYNSERSDKNLATSIKQLLIDVQNLDALDFSEWARSNINGLIDPNKIDTRIRRFTTAFGFMFESKKFKKISNVDNAKEIFFEGTGGEMTINQLSSGEKQIVFRGSFLLKDKESTKGAIVLIDEPELSLHPKWQLKILSYFKKLFTTDFGEQTSQLIVTTHSPFIIHNSNRNDDKVIILQKASNGNITVSQTPQFYGWSNERLIQEAFDISHTITDTKSTAFLEGETDEEYYNKCLEIFGETDFPIQFKWIGRINDNGNAENSGDTALNQAKTFFTANMDQVKNKIILLYDNDTNKPNETVGDLLVRKMSKNAANTIFKIGVENLLTLIPEIDIKGFYRETQKTDDYGAVSIIKTLDKKKLCNFICNDLSTDKQEVVLNKVKEEIDRLRKEV